MIIKPTHPQQWVQLFGEAPYRKICKTATEYGGYSSNPDIISGPKNC